jgi:hypothetical protein
MNQQVAVEVSDASSNRATVEVIQQGGTRVVEITRPEATPVVEVLLPGPQGPPGPPGDGTGIIDGGTFN